MKTISKKNLLIYWTSRTFMEIFEWIVMELAQDFNIVILLLNYSSPPKLNEVLDEWVKNGVVKKYLITPKHTEIVKIHLFMRQAIKELKPYNFDVWLSISQVHSVERYIQECILPKKCVSIIFWQNITYLFMYHEEEVRKLLFATESAKYLSSGKAMEKKKQTYLEKVFVKIKKIQSLSDIIFEFLPLFFKYLKRKYYSLVYKKFRRYCDRYLLPLFIIGKTFPFKEYDLLTELGSGGADAVVFTDEIEAQAHKLLYKTPRVYVAQYPTYGSCRCKGEKEHKNAVLSPLSGFEGSFEISQERLFLFLRDFKTVISATNAESLHLRTHPNETGAWHYQLRDYLIKHGINAELVDCRRSIREVVCDYMGVAGYASSALRDARASCDYAFVIGFEGISKFQFSNPRFIFGKSEGIGWIREDGTYEQEIFDRERYIPPKRKTVAGIVKELSKDVV